MVVKICFSIECFAAVYASIFSDALMHSEMQKERCLDTIALKATCVGAHISNPSRYISRVKVLLVDPEVIIPCVLRLLAILAFIFLLFPLLSLHVNLLVLMIDQVTLWSYVDAGSEIRNFDLNVSRLSFIAHQEKVARLDVAVSYPAA